jgi:opacity protein-like surface antigen
MKSTSSTINVRLRLLLSALLLSLPILNLALNAKATDTLAQEPRAAANENNEIDFNEELMPSPAQVLATETTPAQSKPKVRKTTLTDPRGFHSTPYSDTSPDTNQDMPASAQPEPRERLRPELHSVPPQSWYRKFYARFDIGQDTPKTGHSIGFKNNQMLSGGLGYRFNEAFRADINFQFRKMKPKPNFILNNINNTGVFLNAYYDLSYGDLMVPFLTVGAGYVNLKLKPYIVRNVSTESITIGNASNLAWNAGVGLKLRLCSKIHLSATYRYIDFGKIKRYNTLTFAGSTLASSMSKLSIKSHEFAGGLTFNL